MAVSDVVSTLTQATPGDKILYLSFGLAVVLALAILYEQLKGVLDLERYTVPISGKIPLKGELYSHVRWGVRLFGGLLVLDYLLLVYYFVSSDFTYNYVWTFSDRNLSLYYKISAALAGQQGTFLFWVMIIGLGAVWLNEKKENASDFIKNTQFVVLVIGIIFLLFTIKESPFTSIYQLYPELPKDFLPDDGNGLNPLLVDPWMAIHPLVMFVGYAATTNPFAISIVYLFMSIRGRGSEIEKIGIKNVIQFCRVAWLFLTWGIAIGGVWAYTVLGWGGFWAWDPVETASFIPWLMLTGAMHALVEHRKDKKKYAILAPVLVSLSFSLVVYATLITRSGFFESVHAFSAGTIGYYLVALTAAATVMPLILGALRYVMVEDKGAPKKEDMTLINRTNIFYVTILFLIILTYISVWGVTYPAILKLATGKKVGTGVAFFNLWSYPFFMGLLLLAGLCLNFKTAAKKESIKELGVFSGLTLVAAVIQPSDAWNIVDYSAVVSASQPLLYSVIGRVSALSFIPPVIYIVYGLVNRYNDQVKTSKKRNYTIKEIGILCIHLGIVFITLGAVFSTLFTTEFSASANVNQKNTLYPVAGTPFALSVIGYEKIFDYGDADEVAKVESAPPGISLSEFYADVQTGALKEIYSVRGVIDEVSQTEHITYLKLVDEGRELWVAIDRIDNAPTGIRVFAEGSLMVNFPSPTLGQTFDFILFSTRVEEYSAGATAGPQPYTTTEKVTLAVYENGKRIGEGAVRSITYRNGNANRVMVDRSITRDVYVIYNGLSGGTVSTTVKLKPLVNELWFGVILFSIGIILVFIFDPLYKGSK